MKMRASLLTVSRTLKDGSSAEYWGRRWKDSSGRTRQKSLGPKSKLSERNAKALCREFEHDVVADRVSIDPPKNPKLRDFIEFHAALIGDMKASTRSSYDWILRRLSDELGADLKLSAISPVVAQNFAKRLRDSGLAKTSRRTMLVHLRAAFYRAKESGLIHRNPFAKMDMPKAQSKDHKRYEPVELIAMRRVAPTLWWRALIQLASTSGLRRDELLHLRWSDIDFAKLTVKVQARRADEVTIDGETFAILEWSPKSYELREIPIPDCTLRALSRLRDRSDGSPYAFIGLDRLRVLTRRYRRGNLTGLYEPVNNVLRTLWMIQDHAAKWLDRDWKRGTFHDLRSTWITRMADEGIPLLTLQKWAGHKDPKTTMGYYSQSDAHDDRARSIMSRRPKLRLAGESCDNGVTTARVA